ncbi:MAG TPA: phosphate ABC transporter permease subunit PstC [Actinobacteria bacterium]|nr:phosphate ABC transporter permease subunit PstC [Actinomycetota bacterium]
MAAALTSPLPVTADEDVPRRIVSRTSPGDAIFRAVLRASGLSVFLITGMILAFLILRGSWALRADGFSFFTKQSWLFVGNNFGIGGILPDGIIIAVIAMIIAVPVAVATAIFISEYAPDRLRRPLIAVIDLMAAIPSIIYGVWGRFFLVPRAIGTASWLSHHLSFLPAFRITIPVSPSTFVGSPVIAGMVVSLMAIPIITSLSRQVFSQAPQGEREGAYALGSTRWGMVRTVVLPFGRAGVTGAAMLGLGRAMGETIAVLLVITTIPTLNWHVLQSGGNSVAGLIALNWNEATAHMLSALMAAGLALFAITLIVNSLAAVVINRSRSGAATAD